MCKFKRFTTEGVSANLNLIPPNSIVITGNVIYTKKITKLADKLVLLGRRRNTFQEVIKHRVFRTRQCLQKPEFKQKSLKVVKFQKTLKINETYDFSIAERDDDSSSNARMVTRLCIANARAIGRNREGERIRVNYRMAFLNARRVLEETTQNAR